MDELLVYPAQDIKTKKKRKEAINSKAVLITDTEILDKLKQDKTEKETKAAEKEQKKMKQENAKKKKMKDSKVKPPNNTSKTTKPVVAQDKNVSDTKGYDSTP